MGRLQVHAVYYTPLHGSSLVVSLLLTLPPCPSLQPRTPKPSTPKPSLLLSPPPASRYALRAQLSLIASRSLPFHLTLPRNPALLNPTIIPLPSRLHYPV